MWRQALSRVELIQIIEGWVVAEDSGGGDGLKKKKKRKAWPMFFNECDASGQSRVCQHPVLIDKHGLHHIFDSVVFPDPLLLNSGFVA